MSAARVKGDAILAIGLLFGLAGFALPLGPITWATRPFDLGIWILALLIAAYQLARRPAPKHGAWLSLIAVLIACLGLSGFLALGGTGPGFWCALIGLAFLVWRLLERVSLVAAGWPGWLGVIPAPLLFGAWLLYLWQVIVVGFGVPLVLLPAPSQIGAALIGALPTLGADFVQTFIRAVIPGFLLGSGIGFLIGVLVDRVPFLQRGLLPIGNLVSALPIIGIAPIMVMWFGFDWQSKVAVVVIMTFFPMLVNTITGLNALGRIERDLMATYAANYYQTLLTARLPAAMPFIFNALKVNSTLALIGAIVAEFFGTPILGMGFRISTEVGRMNIAMVWASITVAALAGSLSYGLLALAERRLTFWHPSFRKA